MAEYIEREAAVQAISMVQKNVKRVYDIDPFAAGVLFSSMAVEGLPAADLAPVRHGRWVKSDKYKGFLCCSACHDCYVLPEWVNNYKWGYCPNCGAKMDGERRRRNEEDQRESEMV